jgi:hypothetical protein
MILPCNLQGVMHMPRPISPDWLLRLISLLLHKKQAGIRKEGDTWIPGEIYILQKNTVDSN